MRLQLDRSGLLLGNVSLDTFIRVVLKGDLNVEPEAAIPGLHGGGQRLLRVCKLYVLGF